MAKVSARRGMWFHVLDVVFNVVVIVAIVAVVRTFLVSPFKVEGHSMDSTLSDGEYIVINKLTYILGDPERGDIVVFRPPHEPSKFYVKRVIGIPGDTITLRNGNVHVRPAGQTNDEELLEEYLDDRNRGNTYPRVPNEGGSTSARYVVPDGHYFLLGDNRQNSHDSRGFIMGDSPSPYVPDRDIKGRFWFVALPITKIHAFSPPDYDLQQRERALQ